MDRGNGVHVRSRAPRVAPHPPGAGVACNTARLAARAATSVHAALYVLILAIPLTGWLYSSAAGLPTVYLGLVQLPDLLIKDNALAAQLKLVHITLNYTLLTLVVIHAAAALKHHVVDRDDVLRRMLPFVKPARE